VSEYHKINSIFKRDLSHPKNPLIEGDWASDEFLYLADCEWEFTEKVDGTNIRVCLEDGKVTFGGKTDAAQIPAKLFARLQEVFTAERVQAAFPNARRAVLYGEGFGAGIQSAGKHYGATQEFVLFDVRVGEWWLQRLDVYDVSLSLDIGVVPVIGYGSLRKAVDMVKQGFDSKWGPFKAEGLVARPTVELRSRGGHRIIAKIKCRDFT